MLFGHDLRDVHHIEEAMLKMNQFSVEEDSMDSRSMNAGQTSELEKYL